MSLGDQSYIAVTRPLSASISPGATTGPAGAPPTSTRVKAIFLRSRTEHLGFLNPLHRRLAIIAVVAVLVATLLSYAIARTVTRPLGTITATMREMAATGDLTRRIPPHAGSAILEDEDAQLLATTFNTMTDSIARFQRDAAQRERLSSLGRLSTVVAHEIRNPLMIIKTALRTLRAPDVASEAAKAAVTDIDEETARLNRLVSEVLDFARPIKFERAPADLNALCEDAARATESEAGVPIRLDLDRALPSVVHRPRAPAPGARQHPDQRAPCRRGPGRGDPGGRADPSPHEVDRARSDHDRRQGQGQRHRGGRSAARLRPVLHDSPDGDGLGTGHLPEYHRRTRRHDHRFQPSWKRHRGAHRAAGE